MKRQESVTLAGWRKHESTKTLASEEEDGESQEGGSPLRDS